MPSDLDNYFAFISGTSKRRWKAIIARAVRRTTATNAINVGVDHWSKDLTSAYAAVGLTPVEHAVRVNHGHLVCHLCGDKASARQGHHSHMATEHAKYNEANYYISGSHCRSCLTQFRDNNEAMRHVKASKHCL